GGPVGDFELLLCHGTVCVVGKMRDLILQLSKSSIYSTKPPQRLRSESGFAALCGVSPVPVSSGKTNRYRLNRGGDRAANSALHIIAIGRLRTDAKTKEYVARRVAEGHTKMEAIRCLKRYISREVYTLLRNQNRRINRIPITA
ncbi:transposase, partial [Escherichia coli]|uniref:transposase n=2 Tax=Escherichia coli TaxID=562 RepID=UPI00403E35F7